MRSPPPTERQQQLGCLLLLLLFSTVVAAGFYPYGAWRFGAVFGGVALACMFLKVGWWAPFTIAGVYFGMFILDPAVKGGDLESQMRETAGAVVMGAVGGFLLGFVMDQIRAIDSAGPEDSIGRPPTAPDSQSSAATGNRLEL